MRLEDALRVLVARALHQLGRADEIGEEDRGERGGALRLRHPAAIVAPGACTARLRDPPQSSRGGGCGARGQTRITPRSPRAIGSRPGGHRAGPTGWIEALDPGTLKSVICGATPTSRNPQSSSSSRASLVISEQCVKANSGNVRLCWSDSACAVIDFRPGRSVDLGTLTTEVEQGLRIQASGVQTAAQGISWLGSASRVI